MEIDSLPFSALLRAVIDNRGKTCPTAASGIPLIATNCISNDSLYPTYEKVRYVSRETYDSWFRGHPKPGDLIFVNKGTPGRVAMVPEPIDFCIAQDMVALRVDEKKVYPRFLFALLRSQAVQAQIEQMHVGTLIPHFKKGDFDKLILRIPTDRDAQVFIGDFYFEISKKIDLNRRLNETVEMMAETLFKLWFVIPARASLPKGWRWSSLGKHIELRRGTTYKSSLKDLPGPYLLGLSSIRRNGGFRRGSLSTYGGESSVETLLSPGDLYVSLKDVTQSADLLGSVARVPPDIKRGRLTQDTVKLVFKNTELPSGYVYRALRAPEYREYCRARATGTTNLGLSRNDFLSYEIVIPPANILRKFDTTISTLERYRDLNDAETNTLTALRDTLLPKLLSGEVVARKAS